MKSAVPFRPIFFISVFGLLYFLCGVVSLHFLDHEYNPIRNFISEYAGGQYKWISQSAFWALCSSFILISFCLIFELGSVHLSWPPFLLFSIACVGLAVLTAHPMPALGLRDDIEVNIHNQAAWTGFISIIVGQVLWPIAFYIHLPFRRYAFLMFLISASTLCYFLFQGIGDLSHLEDAKLGLHQRVLVALIWIWMMLCVFMLNSSKAPELEISEQEKR